jgi:hypothetical protein
MTKAGWAMAKRAEGAHANGLETLPLFYGAVVSINCPPKKREREGFDQNSSFFRDTLQGCKEKSPLAVWNEMQKHDKLNFFFFFCCSFI